MVLVRLLADDSRNSRSDSTHTVEDSGYIATYTPGMNKAKKKAEAATSPAL